MARIYTFVGLDLGTKAGYTKAEFVRGELLSLVVASHYDLKDAFRRGGSVARWTGYRTLLGELDADVDAFFFEDVPEAAHTGAGAARVHGGLRATLELFARDNKRRIQGVSIQAAKRALTGSGAANKKMMKTAAFKRFGVADPTTSGDVADSLGVLLAGVQRFYAGEYAWSQEVIG